MHILDLPFSLLSISKSTLNPCATIDHRQSYWQWNISLIIFGLKTALDATLYLETSSNLKPLIFNCLPLQRIYYSFPSFVVLKVITIKDEVFRGLMRLWKLKSFSKQFVGPASLLLITLLAVQQLLNHFSIRSKQK